MSTLNKSRITGLQLKVLFTRIGCLVSASSALTTNWRRRTMCLRHNSLLVLTLFILTVRCDNILFITFPIYSVISPIIPAIDELYHKYGHRTTVILSRTLAESAMVKNSTMDVVIVNGFDIDLDSHVQEAIEKTSNEKSYWGLNYVKIQKYSCDIHFKDLKMFEDLKKRHFDMAIVAGSASAMCMNIIPYKLSIPFMHYGQNYDPVNERIPYSSSFIPAVPIVEFSDKMNFAERTYNFILFSAFEIIRDLVSPWWAVSKYAPEKPYISTTELWKQAEFHLLELDPVMDYPRPVFQNYAFIGGIGTKPAEPLKGRFKDFMDSADGGVVIVSFGSLVNSLPDYIFDKLVTAFNRLNNLKFVFRTNRSISNDKILTARWIPQNDLLGHRNTKLFITHCGNGGQFEALYHGIPMLGFPMFQEQHINARRAVDKGFGKTIRLHDFTVDDVLADINEIITNSSFKHSIAKASEIFRSRPDTPDQRMAYWINHVIKYGGKYLRPASLDIPIHQYLMLDVILFISVLMTVCLVVIYRICTKLKSKLKQD